MNNETMGTRIKQRLGELQMTQTRLACLADTSIANINDVIKGRHSISLAVAIKIAVALNVSLDWLVGREYPPLTEG